MCACTVRLVAGPHSVELGRRARLLELGEATCARVEPGPLQGGTGIGLENTRAFYFVSGAKGFFSQNPRKEWTHPYLVCVWVCVWVCVSVCVLL